MSHENSKIVTQREERSKRTKPDIKNDITLLRHKLQMAGSDAEQFSLRWNNFHSNLVTGFHALLQEVELVDVTLAAEGQFVQAHKIVLSVCSPYFKQLFQVNPCKHPIVILKDVGHKELIAILQFMYQGEVNVRQEELADFLKTAELLQIKGLTGSENSREPDRTPSCTTPQPSSHRQPGSQIHVSDVRSEAHLSEVSQGYPSGNDGSLDLPSPVSEETTPTARPAKRLHSDASVSSSTLSHRKEQKEEHFVQKIPKVEPIDLDMDSELTSDHLSPEGLQQFLTNSGKSTQPRQNISAGGNVNSTPAVPQSHSIHPPSILRHGQVSETSVGSVPSASQGVVPNRLNGRHFAEKIPPTEKKSHPTRVCKVCADISRRHVGKVCRKETTWWCADCDIALCMPECFKAYHTKANYV